MSDKLKRGCFLCLLFSAAIALWLPSCAFAHENDSGALGDYSQYISFSDRTSVSVPPEVSEQLSAPENETVYDETVHIYNSEDFRQFLQNCSDRSWSAGKVFSLENDVDLGNAVMSPAAFFSGTFYGNQHSVSGLLIDGNYARAGLFSTLTHSAYLSELRVCGSVHTYGKSVAGGLAGENYGSLQNVIFQGTVTSEYAAGGIVGLNLEGAYITDAKSGGSVVAPSCAGGITADNRGFLVSCENHADVSSGRSGIRFTKEEHINGITGTSTGQEQECADEFLSSSVLQIDRRKVLFVVLVVLGAAFLSGAIALIVSVSKDDYE